MDWERYRELDRKADEACAQASVTVTFTWDEFVRAKQGMMLLRRWPTLRDDLECVNDQVTPLIGSVASAFASIPEVKEIRAEQMRMLEKDNEQRRSS